MEPAKAKALNSLVLAFVGDAVHTLYVREKLVHVSDAKAGVLHKEVTAYVKASAQAKLAEQWQDRFTEEESEIFYRGRNSKNQTKAKNASVEDYRKATGLEAVIGYLYLTDREARWKEILQSQERTDGICRQ